MSPMPIRPAIAVLMLSALLLALAGCGPDDTPCPSGPVFTHHAIHPDSVATVEPLGNLNPPGHVFPSDHGGYYVLAEPGAKTTYNVQLYAPGDLTITSMGASENLTAGLTDFVLEFRVCDDLFIWMGHVTSLDGDLFGDTADYTTWTLTDDYWTGGEHYKRWHKSLNMDVGGGARLGTVGGNPNQGGLDFGVIDRRVAGASSANPSRWGDGDYLHARFFGDLYEEGSVRDELWAKVDRVVIPNDPHPGGVAMQDVAGTAHGAWFHPGDPTYPEDPHLALVWSHHDPTKLAICVGTEVPTIGPGVYFFTPSDTGATGHPFDSVNGDGSVHGYLIDWPEMTVFIALPDEDTLWIEALPGSHPDPADWVFTDDKAVFER